MQMKAGVILPQGWFGEFKGWDPVRAYDRVIELAVLSERLGFDSLWTGEHVTTKWGGEQNLLECFTLTAAVAAIVPRVEIGTTVLNTTFRNPALTAKMAATLDVVSRGRFVLGLGAGFRADEYEAFGYEFPNTRDRLAHPRRTLGDHHAAGDPGRPSRDLLRPVREGLRGGQLSPVGAVPAHPDTDRRPRPERDVSARRSLLRRDQPGRAAGRDRGGAADGAPAM